MELLAVEAAGRGMAVRAAEALGPVAGPAHWYGGPVAGARLAGALGFALLEPADGWLAELSEEFTGRQVRLATVADAWALDRPTFVKPPRDKSFPADVYADGSRLPGGLDPAEPVLLSEVVTFAAEYRLFLLDGRIVTASRYAVFGRLDPRRLDPRPLDPRLLRTDGTDRAERADAAQITEFVDRLVAVAGHTLPSAVVLDVGQLLDPYRPGHRWAVVEANMAWFSHAYAADPARVLDVVLRAAGPRERVRPADRPFVRD
ncbi:ATP-grasp domain-containing protein [Kitasatospora sp. NBC_00240]|uniref:ATP-grasp domain-containing protein n=1 Tax=Kitasatospora sp. NBC_00240 TaxID=2903567 RepID=UPI00225BC1B9|nr:ATP-grasp domain-containing protein [Kitasatospora sp. NBC_00240]MCX5215214.1 ATP-grasp domain-containing protein [Kitasatospora sp. NBC_00240]